MKGFTLVETIIVVGLMALSIAALALLYLNLNTVLGTGGAVKAAAEDTRRIMSETEMLLLQSSHVLASRSFSGVTYSSNASTLVLELPSIDAAGATLAGKYDYAAIYQVGSTTSRVLAPDAASARVANTKKLATSVTALTFSYDSADFSLVEKVDIDARAVVVVKGKAFSNRLREQVYLRNH